METIPLSFLVVVSTLKWVLGLHSDHSIEFKVFYPTYIYIILYIKQKSILLISKFWNLFNNYIFYYTQICRLAGHEFLNDTTYTMQSDCLYRVCHRHSTSFYDELPLSPLICPSHNTTHRTDAATHTYP